MRIAHRNFILCCVIILVALGCARRDNPDDPLSYLYSNDAPALSVVVKYDTLLAIEKPSNDSHYVALYSEINVFANAVDDYGEYGAPVVTWVLLFNGDTVDTATGEKFKIVPQREGDYILLITATDNESRSFTEEKVFRVTEPHFIENMAGNSIIISKESNNESFIIQMKLDLHDTIDKKNPVYIWDFGDGTVNQTSYPFTTHFYSVASVYQIRVMMFTRGGKRYSFMDTLTLERLRPDDWPDWLYDIRISPNPASENDSVLFEVIYDTLLDSAPTVRWYLDQKSEPVSGIKMKLLFTDPGTYIGWVLIQYELERPVSEAISIVVKQSH